MLTQVWLVPPPTSARAPASLWSGCAAAFRFVVSTAQSPLVGFLRRAPVPRLGRLDVAAVNSASARYSAELSSGTSLDHIAPQSFEETLGLIEAIVTSRGFPPVDYAQVDRLRRGKIVSLLKQLERPSRLSLEAYDDIWAELFSLRLGRWERFSAIFSAERAKTQALALLMQEEIARLGLIRAGKKYALLENPEGSVRRFRNSTLGKSLATSLFNLPVMLGMPPLVLPRFSRVRLPPDLAQDLLDQGLSQNNMARVDYFLKQHSAGQFGITLGAQERYEIIRRTYVAGLGVYFLALTAWEANVRYHEITEEEDRLNDGIAEVQLLLEQAQFLDEQGYDIFEGKEDAPGMAPQLQRECVDLRDCLQATLGDAPWDVTTQGYKECRAFVDPQDKCQQF